MGVEDRDEQGHRQDLHRRRSSSKEKGYDAVFLGVGAGAPAFLGIPGESAGQVYSANEFLTRVNLMGGDKFPFLDTPDHARQEGRRHRRRQHRDGLPPRLQAARRADGPAASTGAPRPRPRPASRSSATPRRRGSSSSSSTRRSRSTSTPTGNVSGMKVEKMVLGEPGREGAPQADADRRVQATSSATRSSSRSAPRPTRSSRSRPRASRSTSGGTSRRTTASRSRRRRRASRASSRAATSSPAAPR